MSFFNRLLSSLFRYSLVQVLLQERHERHDLEARPLPVLHRERVERERVELQPRARFDDLAHGRDARAMTLDPRVTALLRPTAVAVHDDGDVPREAREVDFVEELPLGGARLGDLTDVDHEISLARGYSTLTSVRP
jgi:hypothetical protein